MKRFKNILVVAEQDNGQTRSMFNAAIGLARRNDATLTVFSVVEEIPARRRYQGKGTAKIDLVEVAKRTRMAELRAAMPETEVPVHFEIASGRPHIEIIEHVTSFAHDLVITVPMPPIRRIGLGSASTTMHLLRKCPVPVWVHSPMAVTDDAVVVALGPLDESTVSLNTKLVELGSSLARSSDSSLHIVHAWRLEGETMMRSPRLAYTTEEIDDLGSEVRAEADHALRSLLEDLEVADRAVVHLRKGHAADVISDVIDEVNPNAVVMGTVARTGVPGLIIGNTAERVLSSVERSVLAVKPDGFVTPVGAIASWSVAALPY